MNPLKKTLKYAKKHWLQFIILIALEFVFIFGAVFLFNGYFNETKAHHYEVNEIYNQAAQQESPINSLVEQGNETSDDIKEIEKHWNIFILGLFVLYNIIFLLFFGIVFNNWSIGFILKFLVMNIVAQALIVWIFGFIVDIKGEFSQGLIVSEKSILSAVLFGLIVYLVYIIVFVGVIEARKNKGLKNCFNSCMKVLMNSFWKILLRFVVLSIIGFLILVIAFLLMFFMSGIVGLFLGIISLFIVTIVFPFYCAFFKVYMVEYIKSAK
jgi:hypothetical protein